MYPALDPSLKTVSAQEFSEGFFVTKKNMLDFWDAYRGHGSIEWPLRPSLVKQLPPTLIQTAEYDILRDEAFAFFEQLKKSGVETVYCSYPGTAHGILQMPNLVSKRNRALTDIASFLSAH